MLELPGWIVQWILIPHVLGLSCQTGSYANTSQASQCQCCQAGQHRIFSVMKLQPGSVLQRLLFILLPVLCGS